MARDLSPDVHAHRSALLSKEAILVLFEISANGTVLYVADNTSAVLSNGKTFKPWSIKHKGIILSDDDAGEGIEVEMSNIGRPLRGKLHNNDGYTEGDFVIHIVSEADLDNPVVSIPILVQSTDLTTTGVIFRLGLIEHQAHEIPTRRIHRSVCPLDFGGPSCGHPRDKFTDDQLLMNNVLPSNWRRCSFLRGGKLGCAMKGVMQAIMGVPVLHPENFAANETLPEPRQ